MEKREFDVRFYSTYARAFTPTQPTTMGLGLFLRFKALKAMRILWWIKHKKRNCIKQNINRFRSIVLCKHTNIVIIFIYFLAFLAFFALRTMALNIFAFLYGIAKIIIIIISLLAQPPQSKIYRWASTSKFSLLNFAFFLNTFSFWLFYLRFLLFFGRYVSWFSCVHEFGAKKICEQKVS